MSEIMRIQDIKIGKRFRKDYGDLDELAGSIQENGLLGPIGVNDQNELVCGHRRLKALQLLGETETAIHRVNPENMILAERDENECRKPFTPSEQVAIDRELAEQFGERRGRPSNESSEIQHNCAEFPSGMQTRDYTAKLAGFTNRETARRAGIVVDNGIPELVMMMDSGEVAISTAAQVATLAPAVQGIIVSGGSQAVREAAQECRRKSMQATLPLAQEQEQDEQTREDEEFDLIPPPITEAEKSAAAWGKLLDQFLHLAISLNRRGTFAKLASEWPTPDVQRRVKNCRAIYTAFQTYETQLQGVLDGRSKRKNS